jgi:hypothetical protein
MIAEASILAGIRTARIPITVTPTPSGNIGRIAAASARIAVKM